MLINQMPAYLDVYALGMLGAMAYLRMRRAWEHMRPARRRALSWACAAGFAAGVAVVLAILTGAIGGQRGRAAGVASVADGDAPAPDAGC